MSIMRGFERSWVVFRFTVIPRSFRWLRIFEFPSVREARIWHEERGREIEEEIRALEEENARLDAEIRGLEAGGELRPRVNHVMKNVQA